MRGQLHYSGVAVLLACLCLAATGRSAAGSADLQHRYPSALMSYLYIEPREVRHEVLASVPALATWMDLGLRGKRYIEADELEQLSARMADLLRERNPVRIDGRQSNPALVHGALVRTGSQGIKQIDRPQRLELATATVGVILSFATDGMPQEVSVEWGLFSDQLQRVPVTATDPSGPRMTFVTPDDPVFTWHNTLRNYEFPDARQIPVPESVGKLQIPIGTVLCVLAMLPAGWQVYARRRLGRTALGPGVVIVLLTSGALFSWAYSPTYAVSRPAFMITAPDDREAVMLLQSLLRNIYRSCNLSRETAVYDRLALTVSGDLLDDVYHQLCRSVAVPEPVGTPWRVTQLQVGAASATAAAGKPPAIEIRGLWSVLASLGRWGYRHERHTDYAARLTVQAQDDYLTVTGLELLDARQPVTGTTPAAGEQRAPQDTGRL